MEPLDVLIRRHGGVVPVAVLRDAGFSPRALRSAVGAGAIVRVRQGVYGLVDCASDVRIAAVLGGRLAGLNAAGSYGLWDGWDDRLHVAVRPNARGVPPASPDGTRTVDGRVVVVHWIDDRRSGDFWRVSPGRAVSQVVRWHDWETAAACIESALAAGALRPRDRARVAAGLDSATAAAVMSLEAGAQSGLETIVRIRLERMGYRVVRQAAVARVGRVDLRIVGTRIVIEIDGYEYHSGFEAFTEDRRRDGESASQGLVVLRFTAGHVRDSWAWMARVIDESVAAMSFEKDVVNVIPSRTALTLPDSFGTARLR